jgi:hypothetical protein
MLFLAIGVVVAQVNGMKDFGNRLEGTNIRPNGADDLVLLGLDGHFDKFDANANLRVRFFFPKVDTVGGSSVLLEAVELHDSFHYLMRAKTADWTRGDWNEFQPWPTTAVIDVLQLKSNNLGVRIEYQPGGQHKVYVPAYVYHGPGEEPQRTYTFHFKTGQDLQQLEIFVLNSSGEEVAINKPDLQCSKARNANCVLYAAGSTQAFSLNMGSLSEGEYEVRLVGHIPRTSFPASLRIPVYHHP